MTTEQLAKGTEIRDEIKRLEEQMRLVENYKDANVGWEVAMNNFKGIYGLDKGMIASIKSQILNYLETQISYLKKEFEKI